MSTRVYRAWLDRIDSGVFKKSECLQWAHAVIPISEEEPGGGFRTILEPHEARELRQKLAWRDGVRLTPEHETQGVAWIEKHAKSFPTWVAEDFDHFTFEGEGADLGNAWRPFYVPVWKVHGRHGQTLEYYVGSWQSGHDQLHITSERVPA